MVIKGDMNNKYTNFHIPSIINFEVNNPQSLPKTENVESEQKAANFIDFLDAISQ